MKMRPNVVDQRGASPSGDNVAGNKTIYNTTYKTLNVTQRRAQIEGWLQKLAEEVREDKQAQQMVDSLQYFLRRHSADGVDGLEAKLEVAGRSYQKSSALR